MEKQSFLKKSGIALGLILAPLLALPPMSLAQWERVASGIASGGVVPDIQTLDVGGTRVVWAASMGTGLFRNAWTSQYGWDNDWDEFLPGKGFFGVDAIYHDPDPGDPAEYVLGASYKGVWYKKSPMTTSGWDRPNGYNYPHLPYPDWRYARIVDAAFYCDVNAYYANDPQDQYFVSLAVGAVPPQGYNPGIYKWDDQYNEFDRVDAPYPYSNAHQFADFCRDKGNPNIIWVTSEKLYKISGSYSSPWSGDVSIAGVTVEQVYSFNQWKDASNNVHSYVLIRWNNSGTHTYSVYYALNLHTGGTWSSIWTDTNNLLQDVQVHVVGKPYIYSAQIYHYLWFTAGGYGVWLYDTHTSTSTQINGSTQSSTTPQLKRWEPRCMIPDFLENLSGNEVMRIFLGTHHYGVWYLTFTSTGTGGYTWTLLKKKFYAAQNRDLRLIGTTPTIIVPSYFDGGLWENSGSSWSSIGIPVSPGALSDPACNKGMQTAIKWDHDATSYDYYFGDIPYLIHMSAFGTADNVEMGGLFGMHSTATISVERVDFDPGNSGDDRQYTIARLAEATVGATPDHFLYVSTGMGSPSANPDNLPHVICQKYYTGSSWLWDRIAEFRTASYDGLCPLAIAPDPFDGDDTLYVGMGNYFGLGYSYYPKVLKLNDTGGDLWHSTTLWDGYNCPGYLETSVHDLTVTTDPRNPDKIMMFWGVAKFSEQWSAASFLQKGSLWKYSWYGNDYHTDPVYDIGNTPLNLDYVEWDYPPAVIALECFNHPNRGVIVAAVLAGTVDNELVSHIYIYIASTGGWRKWYTPANILSDNVYPGGQEIHVDTDNGYDIYVTTDGGPLIYNNTDQLSSIPSSGWNWVSFNCVDPEDSLKYLFAYCDSLEVIRDQYGNRYKPYDNPPLDEIHVWNWLKCHSVKSWVTDTMAVFGPQIPYDSTMVLYPAPQDSSWIYNYIAYLPTDTMTTRFAFEADSDTVLIVKNDDGQFWRPPDDGNGFNMVPGEGYQVGVSDTMTFNYPASQSQGIELPPYPKEITPGIASLAPSHFQFTEKTGDFYPIYIENLLVNGQGPAVGDEVGVFAPNYLCVGAAVYEGDFPIKIAAWKDDPCTEAVDGYNAGETLNFMFYDASAGVEVQLELTAIGESYPPSNNLAYTRFEQGYYAAHYLQASYTLPGFYALLQNYPNPFNPSTTIRYDLPFESTVKLEIFDIRGRLVTTLVDGKQAAGFRAIHWNGTNAFGSELASGMYFYRLKADATPVYLGKKDHYVNSHKMVLIK